MHAPYIPPASHAACPHCQAPTPLVVTAPALDWVSYWFRCPRCHREWKETRDRDGVRRFWTPVHGRTDA